MKTAKDITDEFYESIDTFKVLDYEEFIELLNVFDELNYKKINLKDVLPSNLDNGKLEDITCEYKKKYKIVSYYLHLVSGYLNHKTKYKERQKVDKIKRDAVKKANDVYFKAIEKLKKMQNDEYSYIKDKDIKDLISLTEILLCNPLNIIASNSSKSEIEDFLTRLLGNSRKARKLRDIVK